MKLLLNFSGAGTGGSPVIARSIWSMLPKNGEVTVIGPSPQTLGIDAGNVTWYLIDGQGFWARILDSMLAWYLLKTQAFTVYFHLTNYSLFRPSASVPKSILYVHDMLMIRDSPYTGKRQRLKRLFFKYCAIGYSSIVVQTYHMKESVSALYPSLSNRIHVVLPRIDMVYQKDDRAKAGPVIGYPSSGYDYKRNRLALRVFQTVRQRHPYAQCWLTGDKPSEQDGIACFGFIARDKTLQMMQQSDVILFASEIESLGLPIVEALLAEIPVVASDLPYARELLGEAGYYVHSDDPEDWVDTVFLALKNAPADRQKRLIAKERLLQKQADGDRFWRSLFDNLTTTPHQSQKQ
jgi:glycosyltransferase involved in cell wall biosynthesis